MDYILCAAIWYKDLELKKPHVLESRGFRPYNVDRGIVFSGWRHPNCLYQMVAITGLSQWQAGEEVQGFLTSKNLFVTRNEAAKIARDAKQLNTRINWEKANWDTVSLYSEDLY